MSTTTTTRRRQRAAPKLKESCDCCATAKVRCSRERPQCSRCRQKGLPCQFSFSRRAGRRTMTMTSDPTSPAQASHSSSESYSGSPLMSPRRPTFADVERSESNTSSASSSSNPCPGLPIAPPVTPQQMSFPDEAQPPSLDMWNNPPYVSTADDLNAEWFRLTDSFTADAQQHPQDFEPSSPASSSLSSNPDSLLLGPIDPPTSSHHYHHQHHHLTDPTTTSLGMSSSLHASNLLFMETEAIREELHLVANFIGTLEERVDRGVKTAGLPHPPSATFPMGGAAAARHSVDSGFGDIMLADEAEGGCTAANAVVASQLAFHFSAADLRRRLQNIRNEIECIVGFG